MTSMKMSTPEKTNYGSSTSLGSSKSAKRPSKSEKIQSRGLKEQHFASSIFLSSPHPSKLPIPDFEDENEEDISITETINPPPFEGNHDHCVNDSKLSSSMRTTPTTKD